MKAINLCSEYVRDLLKTGEVTVVRKAPDVLYGHMNFAECNVGDKCWVRELWRTVRAFDGKRFPALQAKYGDDVPVRYEADGAFRNWDKEGGNPVPPLGLLRQAILLPQKMSRLAVEVTNVTVSKKGDRIMYGKPCYPDSFVFLYQLRRV